MKRIVFLCFLASTALADEQANRVVPSPGRDLAIRCVWIADDPTGEASIHCAILQRLGELPWSFAARCRAMLFSWSPDARHVLIGVVKPGRDMSLYCLDATARRPRERNLNLEAIESRVAAALPERDPERGEKVAFAAHHQIDFERIEWLPAGRCRLHYVWQFDRQAGEATLTLDVTAAAPALKIEKITPRGPQ